MKKTLSIILSSLLTCSVFSLQFLIVTAQEEWRIRIAEPLTIETELFSYNSQINEDLYPNNGNYVKESPIVSDVTTANFMVSGVFYYQDTNRKYYTLTPVNQNNGVIRCYTEAKQIEKYLNQKSLECGDLLYIEGAYLVEDLPPELFMFNERLSEDPEPNIQYLGYGTDILGKEFAEVIFQEIYIAPNYITGRYSSYELPQNSNTFIRKGDITNTDTVDILDVITLNKTILGKEKINCRSFLAADVNSDGTIDSTDSLNIMKYIVGLIDTFES